MKRTNLVRLESVEKVLDICLLKANHPTAVKHTTTKRQSVNLDVFLPTRLESLENLLVLLFALAFDVRGRLGFGNRALRGRGWGVDG